MVVLVTNHMTPGTDHPIQVELDREMLARLLWIVVDKHGAPHQYTHNNITTMVWAKDMVQMVIEWEYVN